MGNSPSSGADQSGAELVPERQPVNLGDTVQLKRILDDVSSQVIIESDYPEDFAIGNGKIALGLITCAFALVAQFYPKTYPHSNLVQIITVLAYFLFNVLLQMFTSYCEKDIVLFTKPKEAIAMAPFLTLANTASLAGYQSPRDSPPSSAGLALSTCLPRFSDKFTIKLSSWADSKDKKSLAVRPSVTLEKSIAEWFYEDGHLAEDILRKDVAALLKKFESAEPSKDR